MTNVASASMKMRLENDNQVVYHIGRHIDLFACTRQQVARHNAHLVFPQSKGKSV